MTRALFVANEDVADRGIEDRVVSRKDRATRDAEHDIDTSALEGHH
jgi:hypothetical protein